MLGGLSVLAGPAQAAGEAKAVGAFETPARPLWAGEIFDLGLSWRVDWNAFSYLEGPLSWDPPLIIEPWHGPIQKVMPPAGGTQLATLSYRTRGLVLQPGTLALRPARQVMVLKTGMVRTMDYERAITETVTVGSQPASIAVRPLPPPPRDFLGAVGRFNLRASVAPAQAVVGQRLTWTLTLSGMGNWPSVKGLPTRKISRAFESAGAPRLTEIPGATMFEQTLREEVDLIPGEAGRHVLGPVQMSIFDPHRGQYVTVSTEAISLDVVPDAAQTGIAGAAAAQAKARRVALLPPLLTGSSAAPAPMSDAVWRATLLLPFALVAGFWLLLALLRAYGDDPERLARRSHTQLGKTLRQLQRAATDPERRRLVRTWQHHVGLRWKLNRAAPVPASFSGNDAWRELWSDADRFLYGRASSLPADWSERAQRLWREQGRPPGFDPKTMFSRRNFYPTALAMCLVAIWSPEPVAAADGAATAQSFRERVERHPLDWKARHNLAVALAGLDRLDEAAAHAGIAWVQHPSEATRILWTRLAREAGFPQGAENNIPLPSGWWSRFVGAASPPQWQWMLAIAGTVAAVGAILLLLVVYAHAGRRWNAAGSAALAVGAICAATCWASLRTYGALSNSEAVVVWQSATLRPLPVETPPEAGTVVLGAGSAARADGQFLGWRRLRLSHGRSGWVRKESLIWAWR